MRNKIMHTIYICDEIQSGSKIDLNHYKVFCGDYELASKKALAYLEENHLDLAKVGFYWNRQRMEKNDDGLYVGKGPVIDIAGFFNRDGSNWIRVGEIKVLIRSYIYSRESGFCTKPSPENEEFEPYTDYLSRHGGR